MSFKVIKGFSKPLVVDFRGVSIANLKVNGEEIKEPEFKKH